jgi:hypothetical protein
MEDFWPSTLAAAPDPEPVVFLKEQAQILGGKTGGRIQGVVKDNTLGGTVYYSLYLQPRGEDDYLFKILSVSHPLTRGASDPFPMTAQDSFGGPEISVRDMAGFKAWLKSVLSSPKIIVVVGNLLRQSVNPATP